ncbi:hypothetical protein [Gemelliphila palaticanis]|uniref:Uncharacterized protein n=1 Tax=Gemelliphila palaticanis TaxID=81950 RepID=A0ABX2SZ35_9BACL|nr:hypothetical protein [Gemella palaticanis]MBF0715700.1 hypothetical protein [Gemella palaticanis]NYS47630.1 hypothetical protein [Gemella palaticanis]
MNNFFENKDPQNKFMKIIVAVIVFLIFSFLLSKGYTFIAISIFSLFVFYLLITNYLKELKKIKIYSKKVKYLIITEFSLIILIYILLINHLINYKPSGEKPIILFFAIALGLIIKLVTEILKYKERKSIKE